MFVLASKSPRRSELMALTGWSFTVLVNPVDESVMAGEAPEDYVRRVSLAKALASQMSISKDLISEKFILSCDTAVVSDGKILGKPMDIADAVQMLTRLRGRVHQVFSVVTVIDRADESLHQEMCVTDVPMRRYNLEEMLEYVNSGDPMDKAGAYAIQNSYFHPVEKFKGCYANVMGLPLCHLTRLMGNLGVRPKENLPEVCQEYLNYDCPIAQIVIAGESN
jgi:MAF protein